MPVGILQLHPSKTTLSPSAYKLKPVAFGDRLWGIVAVVGIVFIFKTFLVLIFIQLTKKQVVIFLIMLNKQFNKAKLNSF